MKRFFIFTIQLSMLFYFVFAQQLNAQKTQDIYKIGITTDAFTPEVAKTTDFGTLSGESFKGRYFRLLQFYTIPTLQQRSTWKNQGMVLTDYLPGNVYFAVINENFELRQLQNSVRAILKVDNRFRMEPALAALRERGQSTNKLVVSYYASLDAQEVISDLRSRGAIIKNHRDYSRQLDIIINPAQLDEITALPYIQFIGQEPPEPELESYYNNSTGRANYLNTGYNGLNYNGDGVVIAIGEGGTVDNHIDFRGRLTEMVTGSVSSHKVGVMRYAGGGGNDDPTERNNACGATLLSVGASPDYAALYTSDNLRFTNHSLGYGISGGYDQTARDHDLRTATLPLHIISYSAGNSGSATGYTPYNSFSGWANITGQRKQNKNHFAVGSLNPDDEIVALSSRGPMYDGRIIPQLVTEGQAGTSDASPKVVGVMAILAQVYKTKNAGTEAPANLLRAIIMNTADDLGNSGPDFKYGYGKPNMRRAYNIIDNSQFLTNSVADGNTNTHNITVPANTKQVRVMLIWPDVAAAVNANPAIVNNLNLLAKNPSLTSYNPWVLDHTANPTNLNLPATRQVDNLNTIEQVTVDNPASGNWTLEVNGANVPSGPQTYYITYEFLMDELHIGFPLKDIRFKSGNNYRLKWDSYGVSGTFDLDYQIDGGSWVSIVTGYDAASRNYEWTAPSVVGIHTVKIRVQRGALSAESDVNYIGDATSISIDWACGDAVKLKWNTVSGATSYKVYRFVTDHMEEVTTNITFDGTSAMLTGINTTESEYFAVSGVTGSNEGLRSLAKEKTVGDYNCNNVFTTVASGVNKTNITLNGLVNPHYSTLTEVQCAVSKERSLRNYKQDGGTDPPESSCRRRL